MNNQYKYNIQICPLFTIIILQSFCRIGCRLHTKAPASRRRGPQTSHSCIASIAHSDTRSTRRPRSDRLPCCQSGTLHHTIGTNTLETMAFHLMHSSTMKQALHRSCQSCGSQIHP